MRPVPVRSSVTSTLFGSMRLSRISIVPKDAPAVQLLLPAAWQSRVNSSASAGLAARLASAKSVTAIDSLTIAFITPPLRIETL